MGKQRKYNDSEDEGLTLTPGYPGPPPTPPPEGKWMPEYTTDLRLENPTEPPAVGVHPPMQPDPVDIRRFDLRVGKITFAKAHPLRPDDWILTYVDVGDTFPKPIVSQIGKFYKKEDLEKRKVIALCNIEPVEGVRNVGNTAMLMCGAVPDPLDPDGMVYELWEPPPKSRKGDPLRCENYPLKAEMLSPETPFMHNDEGTFNTIIEEMRINGNREVTYKGEKLFVRGLKGIYITTPTFADCGVKTTFI